MKYESKITFIGKFAFELLDTCNSLVLFNNGVPKELAEVSILHTIGSFKEEIEVGDKLVLGRQSYEITAIGDEARHTIIEIGHCTLNFSGMKSVELPGQIVLKGECSPRVKVGDTIAFM
ncbi:PTS glucitol/sorbitol transporter subunit IIA [Clostridium sp. cel8]|uniref:PTS glucitol/sorbitol transporter subunit IIA n=1 Tax=Clostridium sp. cel8 TaxID=2663123 RepID=UPI0015F4262E|nr:PTS glucitol/sorbitol transporter subunit IIA [Clostridium sp. cel8]MBA5851609.1 PTS glucitol/sorbitol transporter subunit IIA [Clostridium sp. cel8]